MTTTTTTEPDALTDQLRVGMNHKTEQAHVTCHPLYWEMEYIADVFHHGSIELDLSVRRCKTIYLLMIAGF